VTIKITLFIALLVLGVCLLGFSLYKARQRRRTTTFENATRPNKKAALAPKGRSAIENIRQIGLIEKDEFAEFYTPVLDSVEQYHRSISQAGPNDQYFEKLFIALRKRRATIFEYNSSETDQSKKAAWTYALFCAISIRDIARTLARFRFVDSDGQSVDPNLLPVATLSELNKHREPIIAETHQANSTNLHLIDQVLPRRMIQLLDQLAIYPYLVNAVTGYYYQPVNPFYKIIEQVEQYVSAPTQEPIDSFEQGLNSAIEAIEQDVIAKGGLHGFAYDGQSYLLVDRVVLWELFSAYSVLEDGPYTKSEFEITLCQHLGLTKVDERIVNYRVSIPADESTENDAQVVQLRNMIALPYSKIPTYRFGKRCRIRRDSIERDVNIGEQEAIQEQVSLENGDTALELKPHALEQDRSKKVTRTSNKNNPAVGELFSPT